VSEPQPGECFWHGVEPIPEDVFIVCGECGHAYPTADDLDRVIRQTHHEATVGAARPEYRPGPLPEVLDLEAWPFCPLCCHDL
jgi:hypothetical protein